jgi:hypothetical protein
MKVRTLLFALAFATAIAAGSTAGATIVWGSCPGGFGNTEVCPIAGDECAAIGDHLTQCQCENHGGVWHSQLPEGEQCQES